jgi:hypothetical protein
VYSLTTSWPVYRYWPSSARADDKRRTSARKQAKIPLGREKHEIVRSRTIIANDQFFQTGLLSFLLLPALGAAPAKGNCKSAIHAPSWSTTENPGTMTAANLLQIHKCRLGNHKSRSFSLRVVLSSVSSCFFVLPVTMTAACDKMCGRFHAV